MSNGIELGLTAVPGDLLEITPSYLIEEERDFGVRRSVHRSSPVCTEWSHSPPRIECLSPGPLGIPRRGPCLPVSASPQCVRTEDRGVDVVEYGSSASRFVRVDQPVGQLEQIFGGLTLRFAWREPASGKTRQTECPLDLFEQTADGKSLLVRLDNRGSECRPFTADPTVRPMLSLIDRIDFPRRHLEGREVRDRQGKVLEWPTEMQYHPEVRFAGKVAIRGYSFGSFAPSGALPGHP